MRDVDVWMAKVLEVLRRNLLLTGARALVLYTVSPCRECRDL